MYLFFVYNYVASKIGTKEKNGRESNNRGYKRAFKIID